MPDNIQGVTFPNQVVTPSSDGVLWRKALSDGVLAGCSISFSGATLTMAAGWALACGREIHFTAANSFTFSGSSGYARAILTLDLTQTSTEEAWQQGSFRVEYAQSEAAFAALTKQDLNGSGTLYELEIARVQLQNGAISQIVYSLGPATSGGEFLPLTGGAIAGDLSVTGALSVTGNLSVGGSLTAGGQILLASGSNGSYGTAAQRPSAGAVGRLFFVRS